MSRGFRDVWLSAVARSSLDYDVRGLLLAMAEVWMNGSGMNCFAAQETIADRCGGSRKAVNRLLGEAMEAGFIRKEYRPGPKGHERLHWTPAIPDEEAATVPKTGQSTVPKTGLGPVPKTGHKPVVHEPGVLEPDEAAAPAAQMAPRSRSRRRGKPKQQQTPPADSLMISETEDDAARRHERDQAESTIGAAAIEGVDVACNQAGVVLIHDEKRDLYVLLANETAEVRADALYRLEIWRAPKGPVPEPGKFMHGRFESVIRDARKAVAAC